MRSEAMTRHLDGRANAENNRMRRIAWKAKRCIGVMSVINLVNCAMCGESKPRASISWGSGGRLGDVPICSQTCRENYRKVQP